MSKKFSYSDYAKLTLPKRYDFFDSEVSGVIQNMNPKDLNNFFKTIILDNTENSYIRRSAQKIFIDCIFLNKLKSRHALNLLIDEWIDTNEVFLEVQRIKDLYFFYNDSTDDVEEIIVSYIDNEELEIASEAYLVLGLLYMQNGLTSKENIDVINNLIKSEDYLSEANQLIENRIDAEYYQIVVRIIIDIINRRHDNLDTYLDKLGLILYKKQIYSFDDKTSIFFISFYRIISSLTEIGKGKPDNWLDYREGFDKLHYYYSEIKNQEIKNRLSESTISLAFSKVIKQNFVEPYFVRNFNSQISKIDTYLSEVKKGSNLYDFLSYIKEVSINQNRKKKEDRKLIENRISKSFPYRSKSTIDSVLENKDIENPDDLLNIYEELKKPSRSDFLTRLVSACISLQGNIVYRFTEKSKNAKINEDDRNKYIAELLNSSGEFIALDQTMWSTSPEKKSSGEIDIMVKDKNGLLFTIIEALILDSVKSDYTIEHIDKVFLYDSTGCEDLFILVYFNNKNFGSFWNKYVNFISNHNYQYKFKSVDKINDFRFSEIRIVKAKHLRNNKTVYLYHIGINLYSP